MIQEMSNGLQKLQWSEKNQTGQKFLDIAKEIYPSSNWRVSGKLGVSLLVVKSFEATELCLELPKHRMNILFLFQDKQFCLPLLSIVRCVPVA